MSSVASSAVIHPGVTMGDGTVIEDFCVVGAPPRGPASGVLATVIGDGAIIRSHTVIYAGNVIGARFQTGNKSNIREANTIGDDVSVGTLSVVEHHVTIGHRVRIHTQVFIPEYCVIEDDAWIGPNVVLTNARYPGSSGAKDSLAGVTIGKSARIGANVTILPGIAIGAEALVGAGSVVTHDVPEKGVVYGSPARLTGSVEDIDAYRS